VYDPWHFPTTELRSTVGFWSALIVTTKLAGSTSATTATGAGAGAGSDATTTAGGLHRTLSPVRGPPMAHMTLSVNSPGVQAGLPHEVPKIIVNGQGSVDTEPSTTFRYVEYVLPRVHETITERGFLFFSKSKLAGRSLPFSFGAELFFFSFLAPPLFYINPRVHFYFKPKETFLLFFWILKWRAEDSRGGLVKEKEDAFRKRPDSLLRFLVFFFVNATQLFTLLGLTVTTVQLFRSRAE
jgi:hypothetical protein